MTDAPVNLSTSGPPETVLAPPDPEALAALEAALDPGSEHGAADEVSVDDRRAAVAAVLVRWPRYLDAWARLGELGRDDIERYAAYRVGYHRGLDTLRASGWRGSGYVRWSHEPNRGFLRALAGLARTAEAIGENDEARRCALFLNQLDPATFAAPTA